MAASFLVILDNAKIQLFPKIQRYFYNFCQNYDAKFTTFAKNLGRFSQLFLINCTSLYYAERFEKLKSLDKVIDRINKVNGTETVILAAQQYRQKHEQGKADVFANAIKHDFRSKNPTTRWSDIIRLK